MQYQHLVPEIVSIAHHAGNVLRDAFGTEMNISHKEGKHNLVTEFDTKVEHLLREKLLELTPTAGFLGEEAGAFENSGELTWVVDPIDGTVNFAHNIPIFCISIGATVNNESVIGVIHQPMTNETFVAYKGGGCTLNGNRVSVSTTETINDSLLVTGFPYNVHENPFGCVDRFMDIVGRGIPIRRLGSAALDLAYTAAGRFDGYWEVRLNRWDMAAGVLMVQEAGGQVTHYNNEPFVLSDGTIIATNGIIHQQLVDAVNGRKESQ